MRIVFDLKRGEQAEVILNQLYKLTQLQTSFGIINLSIVNGQPRELSLMSTIKYFIEHRADVVRRRTDYELRKAREREHILLGFRLALDNIDEVIRLIRAAKSPKEARDSLVEASTRFVFNPLYLKAAGNGSWQTDACSGSHVGAPAADEASFFGTGIAAPPSAPKDNTTLALGALVIAALALAAALFARGYAGPSTLTTTSP